jgi:chromosome segregation ATPase
MMLGSSDENGLRVVGEDFDLVGADRDLDELHDLVGAAEERVSGLESELGQLVGQETETARQLETRRTRRAVVEQQLREEREEVDRLTLAETSSLRNATRVEAEELLAGARIDAEREAAQITEQASAQADDILTEARGESAALLDAGREDLKALEEEAAQRIVELDGEQQALTHRLGVLETLYNELQATLKLVAETSITELAEAQSSLVEFDAMSAQQLIAVAEDKQTTEGSAEEQ